MLFFFFSQSEKVIYLDLLLFLFLQKHHHNPHFFVKHSLSDEFVVNLAATMCFLYEHNPSCLASPGLVSSDSFAPPRQHFCDEW